ncbi:ubiquitination pathway protein [Scheffersomyces stipitis CBS 6054]|uniref:Ubiquitination pathway protein n=1 Tax=Scheffersomyces stipitis (strain ATCC 58785 / CBS 6054 / NBRC 10063 / NRRL Y-11545) TaxID=322104 RepID=A3GGA7_PICST|nr:ubiquitination pathway protein [Scheffersomyces stipitis CBS 6054]EAZ63488.2 ubiquitination pathway protein [Scheffersomyces stipitis CBS 6054]
MSPNPSPNGKNATEANPNDLPPPYNVSVNSSSDSFFSRSKSNKTAPPITKVSSSSLLRDSSSSSSSTRSKRNVPYRPAPEQQRHIDLMTGNSSDSPIAPLSSVSSNTQTEYFDVLPSFQMFQSILKRDDAQFSEDLQTLPPVYGDTTNSSPTPPGGLSPTTSATQGNSIDTIINDVSSRLEEYQLEREHEERGDYLFEDDDSEHTHTSSDAESDHADEHTHNENVAVTMDRYGHSPLDNIDRLPKLTNSPIDIAIYVTKSVPQPHHKNELETRLKEYTSGDMVNGYIIITNNSNKPVDFGLFTVSLEGTIKATERNTHAEANEAHKYNKILMKKFLKMYDFNASYGYTDVPNSAGIEYEAFSIDASDGCVIGLPNERVLKPSTKYKKFFTFRFPNRLLDNSCIHSILPHILPPPSMGVDSTCFYNRGQSIQMNKALGYGFLNIRGTPLLTKDYSFEDVSVSYTIEAKFIDRIDGKEQHNELSEREINDPNSEADYAISKSSQYFLRFIPDLKEQFQYYNTSFHYTPESYENSGIDGKLFLDYLHLSTWRFVNLQNYQLEKEINDRLARQDLTQEEIKNKNLMSINSETTSSHMEMLLTRSQSIEEQISSKERMIGTKIPVDVYGKKKKMILSSLIKIGESKIYVKVPDKVIPYTAPKLLQKYNSGTNEEGTRSNTLSPVTSSPGLAPVTSALTPIGSRSDDLRPISSTSSNHIVDLYNRDDNELIQSLDVCIEFDSLDNSTKPPHISHIDTNVVFWSYYTEYPLPIELGYDFFYSNPEEAERNINDSVTITRNNLQGLKDRVNNYINFLKTNSVYVSKNSYLYLKAIKHLGVKKDTIKDYYKAVTEKTHPTLLNSEAGWKVSQLGNQKFRWTKNLKIPLTAINKNNVNLLPSYQSCLVGRLYCLQVVVKFKGSGSEANEFADNMVSVDIPILVG